MTSSENQKMTQVEIAKIKKSSCKLDLRCYQATHHSPAVAYQYRSCCVLICGPTVNIPAQSI